MRTLRHMYTWRPVCFTQILFHFISVRYGQWYNLPPYQSKAFQEGYTRLNDVCKSKSRNFYTLIPVYFIGAHWTVTLTLSRDLIEKAKIWIKLVMQNDFTPTNLKIHHAHKDPNILKYCDISVSQYHMSRCMTKPTKWSGRPAWRNTGS